MFLLAVTPSLLVSYRIISLNIVMVSTIIGLLCVWESLVSPCVEAGGVACGFLQVQLQLGEA